MIARREESLGKISHLLRRLFLLRDYFYLKLFLLEIIFIYEHLSSFSPNFAGCSKLLLDIRFAFSFIGEILGEAAALFFSPYQFSVIMLLIAHDYAHSLFYSDMATYNDARHERNSGALPGAQLALPLELFGSNFYLPTDFPFKPKSIGACSDLISIPKREPCLSPTSRENPLVLHLNTFLCMCKSVFTPTCLDSLE